MQWAIPPLAGYLLKIPLKKTVTDNNKNIFWWKVANTLWSMKLYYEKSHGLCLILV